MLYPTPSVVPQRIEAAVSADVGQDLGDVKQQRVSLGETLLNKGAESSMYLAGGRRACLRLEPRKFFYQVPLIVVSRDGATLRKTNRLKIEIVLANR